MVKLVFGTKEMGGYVPSSNETYQDALDHLLDGYDLDAPENVAVFEDGTEKRLSDVVNPRAEEVEFRSVAAKKGC